MSNPEKNPNIANDGFPPPPPGPPPAQQYSAPHPDPLNQNPIHQQPPASNPEAFYTQQQQQQPLQQDPHNIQPFDHQQQDYVVPPYEPANPAFAPPPAGEQPPVVGQTVPATTPVDGSHTAHKKGWGERFSKLGSIAATPINSIAHKLGSQSFLPETLDKECDKAAVILKTFCKKGVYADPAAGQLPTSTDPKATESTGGIIDPTKEKPKNRVIVTIPPKVISKALGLAIFTTLRAGFQVSGATGSGILIARLPDGSWGPPSGIQVHSVGGGFQIGLDIYDCVCVINSKEALAAFMDTRVSLGSDLTVVAGPYGAGGAVDFGSAMEKGKDKHATPADISSAPVQADPGQTLKPADPKAHRRSLSASRLNPVFSYVKSRGFYAGVQIDGTVVVERKDANAAFYGERVSVSQILSGQVPARGGQGVWPAGAHGLLEVLRGAEAGILKDEVVAGTSPTTATGSGFPVNTASGAIPVNGASGAIPTGPGHSAPGTEQLPPAYVNDGVHRPEVGDHKYN